MICGGGLTTALRSWPVAPMMMLEKARSWLASLSVSSNRPVKTPETNTPASGKDPVGAAGLPCLRFPVPGL